MYNNTKRFSKEETIYYYLTELKRLNLIPLLLFVQSFSSKQTNLLEASRNILTARNKFEALLSYMFIGIMFLCVCGGGGVSLKY